MSADLLSCLVAELGEIPAGDIDRGVARVLERFGAAVDAPRQALVITLRDRAADIGWRVGSIALRNAFAPELTQLATEWKDARYLVGCPVAGCTMASAGHHRVVHAASELPRPVWDESVVKRELGAQGYVDRLVAVHSLGEAEVFFMMDRAADQPEFSAADRARLEPALPALARFCKWLCLSYGALPSGSMLSPRQRTVLLALLSGRSEKQIAETLGLTVGSTHQAVVRVFRRYGVRSRPELMALWLGRAADEAPAAEITLL
ncbi:MAG: hypothetical protein CMN30_20110 [Sandaracinus sp.]|mgnify:CR=1 FL=1|nr:hypothetical protein [Sandaracinus sp.]